MSLKSLIACGTKVWLDSIDPDYVKRIRALGGTGATSNPIIIADLIKTGRFDDLLTGFLEKGMKDEEIAWATTDHLVKQAQAVFLPAWEQARGDDGYVSFELEVAELGRNRQRQGHVADEPGFLEGQGLAAEAGNHLRQHRYQKAQRSAG